MQKLRVTVLSAVFGMNCEYLFRIDTNPFAVTSTILIGILIGIEIFFE